MPALASGREGRVGNGRQPQKKAKEGGGERKECSFINFSSSVFPLVILSHVYKYSAGM